VENHVHRAPRLGSRRSLNLRIGITYDRTLGAYQLDLTEEELKAAPSFTAGEEFDWGDRSREIEIHNYYRVPPYWGAY
jgi:hypothetical protein